LADGGTARASRRTGQRRVARHRALKVWAMENLKILGLT